MTQTFIVTVRQVRTTTAKFEVQADDVHEAKAKARADALDNKVIFDGETPDDLEHEVAHVVGFPEHGAGCVPERIGRTLIFRDGIDVEGRCQESEWAVMADGERLCCNCCRDKTNRLLILENTAAPGDPEWEFLAWDSFSGQPDLQEIQCANCYKVIENQDYAEGEE
jgi:hypothetical protein